MNNTKTIRNFLIAAFIAAELVGWDVAHTPQAQAQDVQVVVQTPTTTPELITEVQDTPESYIVKVFGEHSDKAFLLLKGEGCAENRTLNPKAVNDNRTWGGVGRDRGIFQINDKYHPLTDDQAFDFKQNIDYAYRMFENDNYHFVRWTCGRYHNI